MLHIVILTDIYGRTCKGEYRGHAP